MRITKVIGNVTLSRVHPQLSGVQWKLVVPMSFEELVERREPVAEELVAYDELGCGIGEWVALSEGVEAAMPFYPHPKPIDAYAAAILDGVELDQAAIGEFISENK